MISEAVRRILTKEHTVLVMSSAGEAHHRIMAGERFDVVLCDLLMPQMTGMELHAALLVTAPDQAERMRFITGGTFTQSARAFVDQRPDRVILKPFRAAQLRELVAAVLAGRNLG
jgi:DNA-binding NarL/FixJ family response regulator